jgi:hypothetical protein
MAPDWNQFAAEGKGGGWDRVADAGGLTQESLQLGALKTALATATHAPPRKQA